VPLVQLLQALEAIGNLVLQMHLFQKELVEDNFLLELIAVAQRACQE
jgi:hypothetical protein